MYNTGAWGNCMKQMVAPTASSISLPKTTPGMIKKATGCSLSTHLEEHRWHRWLGSRASLCYTEIGERFLEGPLSPCNGLSTCRRSSFAEFRQEAGCTQPWWPPGHLDLSSWVPHSFSEGHSLPQPSRFPCLSFYFWSSIFNQIFHMSFLFL